MRQTPKPDKLKPGCPDRLAYYIALVNLISDDFDIPNRRWVESRLLRKTEGTQPDEFSFHAVEDELRGHFGSAPPELVEYVFGSGLSDAKKTDAIEYDNYLEEVDRRLGLLEELSVDLPDLAEQNSFAGTREGTAKIRIHIPVQFTLDESGYFKASGNDLFDLLTKSQVRGDRIRQCVSCERIFWASRNDMKACCSSCANAYRQKRWRDRNVAEYNARRRANYRFKKRTKRM